MDKSEKIDDTVPFTNAPEGTGGQKKIEANEEKGPVMGAEEVQTRASELVLARIPRKQRLF